MSRSDAAVMAAAEMRSLTEPAAKDGAAFGMGVGGESGGPGNIAVAGGVERVAAFGKGPAGAGVKFGDSKEIGGDVLLGTGEPFFGAGELVHEGEAEVGFF